jgi:amidase
MTKKASVRLRGFLRRPTVDKLHEIAAKENLSLNDDEVTMYMNEFEGMLTSIDELDALIPDEIPLKHTRRTIGSIASSEDDPFNAVVRWVDVPGASDGPLFGKRVGVKDNIAVAGIPVTNGSRGLSFVPTMDAVVVERILDAGGRIVAKTNLDDYSASGTGESSFFGPPLNPHNPRHSAGGSSGGSGSAVASGLIDIALAADQGGSARIPAAFNGVVSLLATHGRIPSFGVTYMDHTIDYVCPIARTVGEVAQFMDVLSGDDSRDPQWQRVTPQPSACVAALDKGVDGLTIAILDEGASADLCEPDVLATFEKSVKALEAAGATIVRASAPLWKSGWSIELALLAHLGWSMAQSEGIGGTHRGYVDAARSHGFALARRAEADGYSPFYKLWMLMGRYLHDDYYSTVLAKAMNLRWTLTRQVNSILETADAIIMPTTPHVATELLAEASGEQAMLTRGTTMVYNTAPTNLTGHPSLAVPNGLGRENLPTSIQIVAKHGADELTFAIGAVIEAESGSFPPPSRN